MTTIIDSAEPHRRRRRALLAWAVVAVLGCATAPADAQQSFKSADDAAAALVKAAKAGDRDSLLAVLGEGGADIISSGDSVADAETRARFIAAYDEKHEISTQGDKMALMLVGKDDFPLPIPLVRKGDAWQFDTSAGRQEILYRRIGRNESAAIQSSLAYVDAQNEYAERDHGAGVGAYAQRIISTPGKKDGLYWPTAAGEEQSPLGELIAGATAQGYRVGRERSPYHGYYYKILTRQARDAPGGTLDYVVNGKMIGGFALVAYPAEYGNSGVMTFMVNQNGLVLQKNLGPQTAQIVERITSFDPDQSWTKVDDATASGEN